MTIKNLATVLCRCLAIYTLIFMIGYIQTFIITLFQLNPNLNFDHTVYNMIYRFSTFLMLILFLLMAYKLWFSAEGIASRMTHGMENQETIISIQTEDLQAVAFSTLGFYLVASALSMIHYISFSTITINESLQFKVEGLEIILRAGLGMVLLFGSRGIVGLFRKFREYGLVQHANENNSKPKVS